MSISPEQDKDMKVKGTFESSKPLHAKRKEEHRIKNNKYDTNRIAGPKFQPKKKKRK